MNPEAVGVGSSARPEAQAFPARFASEGPLKNRTLGTLGRAVNFTLQRRVAAGLGIFSIGLGLLELLAPRRLARLIGLEPAHVPRWLRLGGTSRLDPSETRALVLRGLGARDVVSGIGILTRPRPAAWLWSRVAGDLMNLSLLGLAFTWRRADRPRLIGATAAVLAVTALDAFVSMEYTRMRRTGRAHETRRRRVLTSRSRLSRALQEAPAAVDE
jgi:hypothetical protein